jgi:hypothetical protein
LREVRHTIVCQHHAFWFTVTASILTEGLLTSPTLTGV